MSLSGRIQTPLGTFKATIGAASIAKRFDGVRTLTIVTGVKSYVYKLEHGHPYSIKLPSDENGQAEIRYSGTDDNLTIDIPNPTNETISELKQKLKEEQEARERAEGTSNTTPGTGDSTGAANNVEPTPSPAQSPTPLAYQALTHQQCQELIAQYTPDKFLYVPSECKDMFQAYQEYLKQQEYEATRRQQQEEDAVRQRQREDDYARERQEDAVRRREEESSRRRQQKIDRWANTIEGILRRRRW